MAKYCDSVMLEEHWYHWLLASETPSLDNFRDSGLLWTKLLNNATSPLYPFREHCIAVQQPIYFSSSGNEVDDIVVSAAADGFKPIGFNEIDIEACSYDCLPYLQQGVIVKILEAKGFKLERSVNYSWSELVLQVDKICSGISKKFKLSDNDNEELAQEALRQVLDKLIKRKLVYEPGRAPVFNLLTTTIYRCIFSTLNKSKKNRANLKNLADNLKSGSLNVGFRSLKIPASAKSS